MIISKLNQIRTRFRQERQAIEPLDKTIGVSYNLDMEPVTVGDEYIIRSISGSTNPQTLVHTETIRMKFNNTHVADNFAELVDSSFSYHDFSLKRPNIETRFIYNYEFANYENYTRNANEMDLPSGVLFSYLNYFGEGYSLKDDIKSIGGAFPQYPYDQLSVAENYGP